MAAISVKALQLGPDADVLPQDAGEHPALGRALEAGEAAARVGAAARHVAAGDEGPVAGREPQQVALRRPPAAAGALPDGPSGAYPAAPSAAAASSRWAGTPQ